MSHAMTKTPCRKIFTDTLIEMALNNRNIIAVSSDARGSVTLDKFAGQLPEQYVEVGIAEQNAIGVAAGLASCGKNVFVCGPASFYSTRSLEQVKVDVAYSGNPVKVVGVSGGVSYGALGSTHHSLHDIAVMCTFPGMNVFLPCDNAQTRALTLAMGNFDQPAYIRMGRGPVPDVYSERYCPFTIGKANVLMVGTDITLIGTGETVFHCLEAGKILRDQGIEARVIDMHTLKPLDTEAIIHAATETGAIITVEEHSIFGGLGSMVALVVAQNCPVPVKIIGIPDENAVHGSPAEIFDYYGISADNLASQANKLIAQKSAVIRY